MVLEGNPIAQEARLEMGHSPELALLLRLRLLAAAGHCHQHHQRAGRCAQLPIRLADAFAGRADLPRLARRARPGNQRHALSVLSVCPNRADRRGGRGGDLFQRVAAVPLAIGLGIVAYALAVAFYTLLGIWRMRRSAPPAWRNGNCVENSAPAKNGNAACRRSAAQPQGNSPAQRYVFPHPRRIPASWPPRAT